MSQELITKYCKRCDVKFQFGDMDKPLNGQMARKYCDTCKVLQNREYARNKYIATKIKKIIV